MIMPSHLPSSSCLENCQKQCFVLHGKQIVEASSLRRLHVRHPSPAVDWCRWVSCHRRRRPVGITPHVALLPPAAESSHHCLAARSQGRPPACAARELAPWCLMGTGLARDQRGLNAAVRDGGPRQGARRPDKGHLR
jgi:hypothetical protein